MVRMLTITDPAGRYAEHKQVKAFKEADVFYYQGTDFIAEVEYLLTCEFQKYLESDQISECVIKEKAIIGTLKLNDQKTGKPRPGGRSAPRTRLRAHRGTIDGGRSERAERLPTCVAA